METFARIQVMMSEYYKGIPDCWDVTGCNGVVREVCPAYPDHGKECWKVTGTCCAQGSLVMKDLTEKIIYCRNKCRFYKDNIKAKFHRISWGTGY